MDKVEILKVDCKPRKVRIYRVDLPKGDAYFIVYEGRRKAYAPNAFVDYYAALKRCMNVALGNRGYQQMTEARL